ncbi:hypothetical protein Tco_1218192 [Tanacetum coccineum]
MVAFLNKSEGSEDFHQIIDFLNLSHIKYALTENPTIYTSLIQQFWETASASTSENEEMEITATIDGRVKTITEASIRRHLKLEDSDGIPTLPNAEIFEQLALMGYASDSDKLTFQKGHFSPQWRFLIHTILHCLSPKKTAWEQFSSNIATAIICLATNRTFNFSKMIFEGMLKNLDSRSKFLMYPRFIQIFLNKHKRHLLPHKRTYVAPTLTQKLFSNMRRVSKGYIGVNIPLFPTMLTAPESSPSRITSLPSLSPQIHPSTSQQPPTPPFMQTIHDAKEPATMPYDSSQPRIQSLGSDEGSLTLNELMVLYTTLSKKVEDLQNHLNHTKLTYGVAYTKPILRVKKLEHKVQASKSKRRSRVIISDNEEDLEDSYKQGRIIVEIDQNPFILLVQDDGTSWIQEDAETQGRTSRRNQIALDEQIERDIQAKLDAELIEEQKLEKKQEEEANIALIERKEENSYFPTLGSTRKEKTEDSYQGTKENSNVLPNLKHMVDNIQTAKDKETDEDDEIELKRYLVIKKDEDIAIDAIPLSTKLPVIIDYKLLKEAPLSPAYVSDPMELEHHIPVYVSEPVYSKYLAPSDDYILVEDQPLPAAASPAALSLGYVANSDPEEDPIDYAADDDDDDEEEEESSEDDDDEEEEHLAYADSTAIASPAVDPVPSSEEIEPFETDDVGTNKSLHFILLEHELKKKIGRR